MVVAAHAAVAMMAAFILCASTATGGVTSTLLRIAFHETGTMSVARGRTSRTIDIKNEITGCTGTVFDGSTGDVVTKRAWKAKTLSVDAIHSDSATYAVLVLIASYPKCNIQADCGAAGDDVSLLLVYLDDRLRPVKRQRVDVQSCSIGADITEAELEATPEEDPMYPVWYRRIAMADGKLRVRFKRYKPDLLYEEAAPEECVVTYERSRAEEGLTVHVSD